jgi:hypothetical protein
MPDIDNGFAQVIQQALRKGMRIRPEAPPEMQQPQPGGQDHIAAIIAALLGKGNQ